MELKLVMFFATLVASVYGIPPGSPKFVPVFVSSDALNSLNEKNGAQTENRVNNEPGPELPNPQAQQSRDYDLDKEIKAIFNTPAPVYEHQPHDYHDSGPPRQGQPQYQENQPSPIQQQYQPSNQIQPPYPMNQQPGQSQPLYQISQQPNQNQQLYQISQQPNQNQQLYQISQQPGQNQQLYQINQSPGPIQQPYQIVQQPGQIQQSYQVQQPSQPILVAQQGQVNPQQIYPNQQIFSGQPLQANQQINQQPILLNRQPFSPNQPIQAFPPANQQPILISQQPMGSQQIISAQPGQQILLNQNQPSLPNQQAVLLQQPPNGQQILLGNAQNPVNLQANPGQIQSHNQNVYAVVPLGNQNLAPSQNLGNSNTYLVPIQQLPNQVYAVNAGK